MALNSKDGKEKVYEKIDALFFEDINQSAFFGLQNFQRILETT